MVHLGVKEISLVTIGHGNSRLTGDTLLYSYNCNYDDVTECGYVQDWTSDNLDWLRYDVGSGPEGFSAVAPSVDATLGKTGRGIFQYVFFSSFESFNSSENVNCDVFSKVHTWC